MKKVAKSVKNPTPVKKEDNPDCFIIMPISDPEGYEDGHFKHVYNNIIIPSCKDAGYKAVRGDDIQQANLIHLDILNRLMDAPMAICDLSSRNPNVLFELGIRQAFDKPVVLIQEEGTPKIFDIAPIRCITYSKEMKYHDVLNFQEQLSASLTSTASAEGDNKNVNSIVRLMALGTAAKLPDLKGGEDAMTLNILRTEMKEMKNMIRKQMGHNTQTFSINKSSSTLWLLELERRILSMGLEDAELENSLRMIDKALFDLELLLSLSRSESEKYDIKSLITKSHAIRNEALRSLKVRDSFPI